MGRLEGKVCLITGASSGVGAETAAVFAKEGAKVAIVARRGQELQVVADDVAAEGGEVFIVAGDISKNADEIVAKTLEKYGKIDVLINAAGVLESSLKAIDSYSDDDLDRVLDINTKGTMAMTRAVASHMAETGRGSIVTVASSSGVMGNGGAAYVASKAALIGLNRHTALRFAGTNVRSNVICPGTIVTPMTKNMNPDNVDMAIYGQIMKHNDLQIRFSRTKDVANILLFFASDESRSITGECIVSDFGVSL